MIQEYLSHHFERDPNDGFDIKPAAEACRLKAGLSVR
jgi:hypothetical protein